MAKRLTPAQVASLGGLGIAAIVGSDGMKALGTRGGNATKEKYGRDHYKRAALKRWGYTGVKQTKELAR